MLYMRPTLALCCVSKKLNPSRRQAMKSTAGQTELQTSTHTSTHTRSSTHLQTCTHTPGILLWGKGGGSQLRGVMISGGHYLLHPWFGDISWYPKRNYSDNTSCNEKPPIPLHMCLCIILLTLDKTATNNRVQCNMTFTNLSWLNN